MKKIILIVALAAMSTVSYAQGWLYAESTNIKNVEDMQTGLEKVKNLANESFKQNKVTDPLAKAIALKVTTDTYKKTFIKMQEERYINNYPDGDYTIYGKFDVPNDRCVYFCPQLGRIIIKDFKNKKQYIVFPKLKTYLLQNIDAKAVSDIVSYTTTKPVADFAQQYLTDLNGFRAMGNYALFPASEASDPANVVTVNGQKYETMPIPGHLFVKAGDQEFYPSVYVEGIISSGVQEGSKHLLQWEEGTVDPANFEIPAGLSKAKDAKTLNKTVQKAVNGGKLAVTDPGSNIDVFWTCFQ